MQAEVSTNQMMTKERVLTSVVREATRSAVSAEAAARCVSLTWSRRTGDDGRTADVATLRGQNMRVLSLLADLPEMLTAGERGHRFPPEWGPVEPNARTATLPDVPAGSAEWGRVAARVAETLPAARITRLQRVQSPWLWSSYDFQRTKLAQKLTGSADVEAAAGALNEKLLFHGTRRAEPRLIYDGEAGFDVRHSAVTGFWGLALYFAEKASYSHAYAYVLPDGSGHRQFFLARAVLGNIKELPKTRDLRYPPPVEGGANAAAAAAAAASGGGGAAFAVVHHDSVTGVTEKCRVHMVYDNQRAYPSYLITYDPNPAGK